MTHVISGDECHGGLLGGTLHGAGREVRLRRGGAARAPRHGTLDALDALDGPKKVLGVAKRLVRMGNSQIDLI